MNTASNSKLRLKIIAACLLGIALVYFSVNSLTENRFQDLELQTRLLISEQEAVLATIAETTARNGADSVTERIIKDCSLSERSAFDTLLSSLNKNLSRSELIELERLFGRCGAFYSERKSVMVSRLAREIEVYESYVNVLSAVTAQDKRTEFSIEQWNNLVQEEQKQSDLFFELVTKQDEIITTLLEGKSADSDEIRKILRDVKEIQETLIVTSKQVAKIRSELISF